MHELHKRLMATAFELDNPHVHISIEHKRTPSDDNDPEGHVTNVELWNDGTPYSNPPVTALHFDACIDTDVSSSARFTIYQPSTPIIHKHIRYDITDDRVEYTRYGWNVDEHTEVSPFRSERRATKYSVTALARLATIYFQHYNPTHEDE